MPSGLKNKTVNLHTTTTKVKIDHTIRLLLTHTVAPRATLRKHIFLVGVRASYGPPLPCVDREKVPVVELLLYDQPKMNEGTTKINKYD